MRCRRRIINIGHVGAVTHYRKSSSHVPCITEYPSNPHQASLCVENKGPWDHMAIMLQSWGVWGRPSRPHLTSPVWSLLFPWIAPSLSLSTWSSGSKPAVPNLLAPGLVCGRQFSHKSGVMGAWGWFVMTQVHYSIFYYYYTL